MALKAFLIRVPYEIIEVTLSEQNADDTKSSIWSPRQVPSTTATVEKSNLFITSYTLREYIWELHNEARKTHRVQIEGWVDVEVNKYVMCLHANIVCSLEYKRYLYLQI